jgi:hypothetical protein
MFIITQGFLDHTGIVQGYLGFPTAPVQITLIGNVAVFSLIGVPAPELVIEHDSTSIGIVGKDSTLVPVVGSVALLGMVGSDQTSIALLGSDGTSVLVAGGLSTLGLTVPAPSIIIMTGQDNSSVLVVGSASSPSILGD